MREVAALLKDQEPRHTPTLVGMDSNDRLPEFAQAIWLGNIACVQPKVLARLILETALIQQLTVPFRPASSGNRLVCVICPRTCVFFWKLRGGQLSDTDIGCRY